MAKKQRQKRNEKHEKRVKKLIVGSGLCAILLNVSTYAWFIGMKTVNVSSFDVEIAAIDQLSLSLDGKKWAETVSISKATYNDTITCTSAIPTKSFPWDTIRYNIKTKKTNIITK